MLVFLFFFFKQKTAYEMRISDWSSDVCSSDLSTELRTEPDSPRVRDRADLRRQVKLVVLFAIAAVILLLFALSIDEPTVRYSLSDVYDPSQNHDANGLAVVWVTFALAAAAMRSEEHTSELQSLMRISYAVFCLKQQKNSKH